jgi:formamidopyrimidine-DNA glycosylase
VLEDITPETCLTRLRSKNTIIKTALLEQSIVAGLGNIYATDALWLAKIHPETKTQSLMPEQVQILLNSAKEILLEGIKHRGSTLPDEAYVDIFGKPGSHQNYFRIYGKTYCPDCKTKVEYKKLNGRGTYFCPKCQK